MKNIQDDFIKMINNNRAKLNFINELSSLFNFKEEKNIFFEKNLNFNSNNLNNSFPQETSVSSTSSINNNQIYLSDLEKTINDSITQIEEINLKKIKYLFQKISFSIKEQNKNKPQILNKNIIKKNNITKNPLLKECLIENKTIKEYLDYTTKKQNEKNEKEQKIKTNKILLQNTSENYSILICSICNNGDIDHNQLMFECKSCKLTVHQNCYGIKNENIRNWICDPCKEMNKEEVLNLECILCPIKGGAMKKIDLPYDSHFYNEIMEYRKSNGKKIPFYNSHIIIPLDKYENIKCVWVHLSCALWNPNIEIGNYEEKKDIKNIDRIDYCKFDDLCNICNKKFYGPCLKCNYDICNFYFHPECARINHYCMEIEAIEQDLKYNIYCFQHYQNILVKTIEKNKIKFFKEISVFNNILSRIVSNYQKIYHNNILSKNFGNVSSKGEYSILNINKKKFIITLKKENIINDYIKKHQLRSRNKNIENLLYLPKKNNNYKQLISINIPGNINIKKKKSPIIKLKKSSENLFITRLKEVCLEYSNYNYLVLNKNIINNNNSFNKKKKKKKNKKRNINVKYSINNNYKLFSLLKYNDLFSNNFPWEKIHFKNFSKEKCIQYFNQLIPNETVFNNKIKIINEEKNNNIIGISLNDNILDLNSDNGDDIKNMIEIKIDNDPKEENLTFEEYNQ